MKRLLLSATLLAAATATASTPALADDAAPKGDLGRFQGSWTGKAGPNQDVPMVYTFNGRAVTIRITLAGTNAREITLKGEVRLDESAKPEKTIDWLNLSDASGKTLPELPGIYAFKDDDTLRLCSAGPDRVRPTEFAPTASGPGGTLVLKRAAGKDADKDAGAAEPAPAPAPCAEPKDEAPKGDLGRLQGSWTAQVGPEKNVPVTLTIKGEAVTLVFTTPDGDERSMKGEVVLNDEAKPKAIDWVKFTGPNGEEVPAALGIYTLDGDEFTVCSGEAGAERPTEFKAGEGGPPRLVVFTRKK